MDKINYAEKILNFNLIVGEQSEDIAYKYLSQCDWDETKAAQLFNEEKKKKWKKQLQDICNYMKESKK